MLERTKFLTEIIDKYKAEIEDAGWWIWKHPQTGFTEWDAHGFLAEKFRALGYELIEAGSIPGFYTDIETGKPGPKLCIMGELDALDVANHPQSVNGMAHCCGHCAQAAYMLGLAHAFREPGVLDNFSGSIRLMLVPAEELIQIGFREQLREDGVITYMGGKPEFMQRGFFDDVDLCMMVHGDNDKKYDIVGIAGENGCIAKDIMYKGRASHAGGAPQLGINAEYAAMLGLQACNDLRETFVEKDAIRFHPIMKGVKSAVNIIPDEMKIESFVRGRSLAAIQRENKKINRALAGAAAAMGAKLFINDRSGYAPELDDPAFMNLAIDCCKDIFGEDKAVFRSDFYSPASSDFGDLTEVMPGIQLFCSGYTGSAHGEDYCIPDMFRLAGNSAKAMLVVADKLMSGGCKEAKRVVENFVPRYASIPEYLATLQEINADIDAVVYGKDGEIRIKV